MSAVHTGSIDSARVIQITRYCQVAPYVALMYDHLLTLDQEVEFVWGKGLNQTTIIYYIARYGSTAFGLFNVVGFVTPLSPAFCRIFRLVQPWPPLSVMWLIQYVLQMRLYVLSDRSKALLALMCIAYITEIVGMTTIVAMTDLSVKTTNEPLTGMFICAATYVPDIILSFWWPPLIFETILCCLVVYIGMRQSQIWYRTRVMGRMYLVHALVMGNVAYFIIALSACVVNAVMWQRLGDKWVEVPEGFAQALEAITGCRLILHLRNLVARQSRGKTATWTTLTQPAFHVPVVTSISESEIELRDRQDILWEGLGTRKI